MPETFDLSDVRRGAVDTTTGPGLSPGRLLAAAQDHADRERRAVIVDHGDSITAVTPRPGR